MVKNRRRDHHDHHACMALISITCPDDWGQCAQNAGSTHVCGCGFTRDDMHMCRIVQWRIGHILHNGRQYLLYPYCERAPLGRDYALVESPTTGNYVRIKILHIS